MNKAAPRASPAGKKTLYKKESDVHALDASGNVFRAYTIWTDTSESVKSNPRALFAKCLVLQGSTVDVLKCKELEPEASEEMFDVPAASAWNVNSSIDPLTVHDINNLSHTNVPCVLDFLKQRLKAKIIYTTADPLLVAMNPFRDCGVGGNDTIQKYREASDLSKMPPSCFGLARTALENMHAVKKSQTIIVSGESGAGKTEAVKMVMRYFASGKSGSGDARIQTAVMAANPVLEAFGNAKTIRNNNSSRFGRFMQLQVGANGGIEYGTVRGFLLEKSRILHQEDTERSYHIFYQMLKGSSAAEKQAWNLKDIKSYKYINPKCLDAPGIDDLEEWADCRKSFQSMMMTETQVESIFKSISAVCLLGNVTISPVNKDGVDTGEIVGNDLKILTECCALWGIDATAVALGITQKISVAGGKEIRAWWSKQDCEMLMGSLSKAMYEKMFEWIIRKLNSNIEPPEGFKHYMAMLDIFGFEVFARNSIEQLFINITNEMLQKNFTDVVFERESKLYREEGVSTTELIFTSNKEVIDVLTAKQGSLMAALEDQCLAPGGSDEKFLGTAYQLLKNSTKLYPAKVSGNQNFVVLHTIGEIAYNCQDFLFKNKDILRAELVEVVQQSTNAVVVELFKDVVVEKGKMAKGQLIGSQFLRQLEELMSIINSTEPHFIRCIKPNEEKEALGFDASKTLLQLHSLSIFEALQLKNLGFSYRRPFREFLYQFKFIDLAVAQDTTKDPKVLTEMMLTRAGLKDGFAIGKTMVFLKPASAKQMAFKQRECMAAWEPMVTVMEAMYSRHKAATQYTRKRPSLFRVQANCRKLIAGRVAAPDHRKNVAGWC